MVKRKPKKSKNAASAAQLSGAWCPIDGSKMSIERKHGHIILECERHGEMSSYLDHDPLATASFVEHCNSIGIVDLEVV